jgi:hypothetical protein
MIPQRLERKSPKIFAAIVLFSSLALIPTATAEEQRVIDVVTVTWPSAASLSASSKDVKNAIESQVNQTWKTLTSLPGQTTDKSINFNVGNIFVSPIMMSQPMACEGQPSLLFMSSVRAIAYQRMGISNFSNRYLIILAASNNCIWSGKALIGKPGTLGGTIVLHDNADAFVITHELGHALGLGHSNLLRCSSGANDGPWGSDCKAVEYGGTVDVMGNVPRQSPLSTYHQWRMGLLESSQIYQSWLSEKIELSAVHTGGKTKAIFIRDGNSTYWIEYRKASDSYSAGLAIYRTDPPPASAIISPNAEALSESYSNAVGTDLWLLNWDNYQYSSRTPTGSMTLPSGKIATFFSSNVSLSAEVSSANADSVTVSINRKADQIAPPAPQLSDPKSWFNNQESILQGVYRDESSVIAGFETLINGQIKQVNSREIRPWPPTYLEPLRPPLTVGLADLPEGNYDLQVRARDIWGNVSPWSSKVNVRIDRGAPVAMRDFDIDAMDQFSTRLQWKGLRDDGVGLCETIFHNEDGFVTQRSSASTSPLVTIPSGTAFNSSVQVFDCIGNGIKGEVSLSSQWLTFDKTKRTGKWSPASSNYGKLAMKCTGQCSLSISLRSNATVFMGQGSADLFLAGTKVATAPASSEQKSRRYSIVSPESNSRVLRITGENWVFLGIGTLKTNLGVFTPIARSSTISDPTLIASSQNQLASLGFTAQDFLPEWNVLPIARGTSLDDATLDLCGSNYLSENQRLVRRQVGVTGPNSRFTFLSSEVVRYTSSSAAKNALSELRTRIAQCLQLGGSNEAGVFTPYSFLELPKNSIFDFQRENRVSVRVNIGSGSSVRNLLAIYQTSGDLFTGLYCVSPISTPLTDSEILRWMKIAEIFLQRMQQENPS